MQSAIETGRLIRDRVKIPMKSPLRKVRLVDADIKILDGFAKVEKFIKEELNCYEIELVQNEDDYLIYSCNPDHREIGSVLKKKFNK